MQYKLLRLNNLHRLTSFIRLHSLRISESLWNLHCICKLRSLPKLNNFNSLRCQLIALRRFVALLSLRNFNNLSSLYNLSNLLSLRSFNSLYCQYFALRRFVASVGTRTSGFPPSNSQLNPIYINKPTSATYPPYLQRSI